MALFNFFKKNKEKRDNSAPVQYVQPFSNGLFFGTYANGAALGLSTVFAAVDIISNSIAELPIEVKEHSDENNDVIKDHYLNKILNNMLISKFNFMKQLVVDMLLYGNSYVYIKRSADKKIVDLVYLAHGSVTIDYNEQLQQLRYKVAGYKGIPATVDPKNMLHFYKNSNNGVEGRGILSYANRAITIGNYTEEAAKDYFGSGCSIKGILKFNEQVMNLNKDEIRQSWQQVHGGSNGSGLAICDYNVDFIPVSTNAAQSQMIESRLFNVTEVARYFGISPVLLQDLSHSSYSTIEASQLEFLTHTLLPYISLFENEFNRKLSDGTFYIDLDETYLMTADQQTKANYITSLKNAGIISINEGRKMLGLSPVDGADSLMINYTNLEHNIVGETNNNTETKEETE